MRAQMTGRLLCILGIVLIASSTQGETGALGKAYDKLLMKQGYQALKAPRSNFGVGTVVPIDSKKNLYIASQEECFPGLESEIQSGTIKLIDSKDARDLKISASANYSPTGSASFLTKLASAFGFTSSATMDVSFGDTTAADITEVTLQNYLLNHKVNKACVEALKNPVNAVIFSMARVAKLTYTFKGSKEVSASVNANAIKDTLTAAGNLDYTHTTDNSVTIETPLYVGYNAFSLKNLQISVPESSNGIPSVTSVTVKKGSKDLFPAR